MTEHLRPLLRVVHGIPTEQETAVLAGVLATVLAARGQRRVSDLDALGQWRARGRNVRPTLSHGPGAWRASGLPR